MTKKITAFEEETLPLRGDIGSEPTQLPYNPDVYSGKLLDELVADMKDYRMNVKRAISADIASTAKVQNQNDRVISACERELLREDLSSERREELIRLMNEAAESTTQESRASRDFQSEQLCRTKNIPWKLIGAGVLVVFGCVRSRIFARAVA